MSKIVTIHKIVSISSAHRLDLPYESKCNQVHGHNYRVEMWITGELDQYGMVLDFHQLKKVVYKLDHINLNDIMDQSTTAENIAIYIAEKLMVLAPDRLEEITVRVWETESAYAEYLLLNTSD